MPGYVRVIRGTFNPANLAAATSVAQAIAEQLRNEFEHFERLYTLKDDEDRFLWVAFFSEQTPMPIPLVMQRIEEYLEQMKQASVDFNVEESGVYELTYSGPAPLAS